MDLSVDTIKGSWSGEQDGGRVVDVEYISLHGYIKNTPSDTEVQAQRQLRVDRSTWPVQKNIQNHAELCRMKEPGEKQEC